MTATTTLFVAFHEWMALARDVRHASNVREGLNLIVRAPGYSSDGSTLTAEQMRARVR